MAGFVGENRAVTSAVLENMILASKVLLHAEPTQNNWEAWCTKSTTDLIVSKTSP